MIAMEEGEVRLLLDIVPGWRSCAESSSRVMYCRFEIVMSDMTEWFGLIW